MKASLYSKFDLGASLQKFVSLSDCAFKHCSCQMRIEVCTVYHWLPRWNWYYTTVVPVSNDNLIESTQEMSLIQYIISSQ